MTGLGRRSGSGSGSHRPRRSGCSERLAERLQCSTGAAIAGHTTQAVAAQRQFWSLSSAPGCSRHTALRSATRPCSSSPAVGRPAAPQQIVMPVPVSQFAAPQLQLLALHSTAATGVAGVRGHQSGQGGREQFCGEPPAVPSSQHPAAAQASAAAALMCLPFPLPCR